jgi:hypothetical protein
MLEDGGWVLGVGEVEAYLNKMSEVVVFHHVEICEKEVAEVEKVVIEKE